MKPQDEKLNSNIISEAEKVKDYLFIVEGKKDRAALENLGFENIFVLNESGKSLGEKIEMVEEIAKNKICILTDFDKKGRRLYKIKKTMGHHTLKGVVCKAPCF